MDGWVVPHRTGYKQQTVSDPCTRLLLKERMETFLGPNLFARLEIVPTIIMSQSPIRIAIIGGGLAGATLIYALLQHSHLDVHIFESAAAFKEAGAAVGIARNALSALDLIGATPCLQRAGAVPQKGVRFMLAQGADAGDSGVMIGEIDAEDHKHVVSIVHRAAFLKELLANVPTDRMHTSKKLESVDYDHDERTCGPVMIHFSDGTTHECDVLVGADGIHGAIRSIILGSDPAAYPRNTGWWAIMALKPYTMAQAVLGKSLVDIEDARQYGWTGDGAWMMHDVLSAYNSVLKTSNPKPIIAARMWSTPPT